MLAPEKQAIVDKENSFRLAGVPGDKSADRGVPSVVQEDPPAVTGMLGMVGAPMPGTTFTTSNAWAGWTTPTTYLMVYAGSPSEELWKGLIYIERHSGKNGAIDRSAASIGKLIDAPAPGGPLHIVSYSAGTLVIANPAGKQFVFDVATLAFR